MYQPTCPVNNNTKNLFGSMEPDIIFTEIYREIKSRYSTAEIYMTFKMMILLFNPTVEMLLFQKVMSYLFMEN